MRQLVKTLVLPPGILLLLAVAGLVAARRRPRLGRSLVVLALALLWLLSTPIVSALLLRSLQPGAALDPRALPDAQAIVVLSAGLDTEAPEYGGDASVGPYTLQRIRYGAWLHRRSGLPLVVSGGHVWPGRPALAAVMKAVLEEELGVVVRWVEDRSLTTWQNARYTAALLRPEGIERVLVVSHAWHMPRALQAFAAAGLRAVPAPTAFAHVPRRVTTWLLPSASALRASYLALHEWLGRAYYGVTG